MEYQGGKYLVLKIINLVILIFWIAYFLDAFLPAITSIEIIRDFEEFSIPRARSGSSYKKIITNERTFTTYADENGFFITDTLELKITSIFHLVTEYRQYSPGRTEKWIYHKLSSHHKPILILTSLVLAVMTARAVFFEMKTESFKAISLFTIAGGFIFYLSLVT